MPATKTWYAVAAVIAVVGLGIAVALGISVVRVAGHSTISALSPDGRVSVGERRVAVYTRTSAVAATCEATPTGGGTPVPFDVPGATVRINTWHRIALSPSDLSAGTYTLSCDGLDPAGQRLGVGENPQVASIVVRTLAAIGIGVGSVVVALVATIITAVRAHSARRRLGTQ